MSKTKEISIDSTLRKDAVEVVELKNLVLDKINIVNIDKVNILSMMLNAGLKIMLLNITEVVFG